MKMKKNRISRSSVADRIDADVRATTPRRRRMRGVMLLEVLLALSILMLTIAVLGAAIRNGALWAERAERVSRATVLTDDLLARLDLGVLVNPADLQTGQEREVSGDFGDQGPAGLSWALKMEPDQNEPELMRVRVDVIEGDAAANPDDAKILLTTHVIRAKPRAINLKNDFGMTDEQLKLLTEAIPGGSQVLDPENFDPTSLARMDMNQLAELLPLIMTALGGAGGAGALGGMGDLSQLGEGAMQGGGLPGGGVPGGGRFSGGGAGAGDSGEAPATGTGGGSSPPGGRRPSRGARGSGS